jgi:hypothetical protein
MRGNDSDRLKDEKGYFTTAAIFESLFSLFDLVLLPSYCPSFPTSLYSILLILRALFCIP